MTKKSLIFASCAVLALAACTHEERLPPPGHYERTSSHTTPSGTEVERQSTTDVRVDRYGNRTAVVEQSTTTDPPGLFNSRTSTSTRVVRED